MRPSLIAQKVKEAALKNVTYRRRGDVAGKSITNGGEAKCFASYIRIHALDATGGETYAEMPRFATADGKGTETPSAALKDPKTGQPQSNPARHVWVSETALGTALTPRSSPLLSACSRSWMGFALLLTGVGFLVLTSGVLGRAGLRRKTGASHAPPTAG